MSQPPERNTPDLQFDKAEFGDAGQDPSAASSGPATCVICKQPVRDLYFTLGDNLICPECRRHVETAHSEGSRIARFFMATVWGIAAGLLGAAIWYAVRKVTGYEIGLIAIVVGLMVGAAVRKGSGQRGGLAYQLLAVYLTYSAIAVNYMPDVFKALRDVSRDRPAPQTQPADTNVEAGGGPSTTPATSPASEAPASDPPTRQLPLPLGIALLLILVYAFAMYATIHVGFSSPIWLLIVGFALWEAWKLNKRVLLEFAGPYSVGPADAGPGGPPPLPPGASP